MKSVVATENFNPCGGIAGAIMHSAQISGNMNAYTVSAADRESAKPFGATKSQIRRLFPLLGENLIQENVNSFPLPRWI